MMVDILTKEKIENWLTDRINGKRISNENIKQAEESLKFYEDMLINKDFQQFPEEEIKLKQKIKTLKVYIRGLKADSISIPFVIPSSGYITQGIVIMPISTWKYAYNIYGLKGMAEAKFEPGDHPNKRCFLEIPHLNQYQVYLAKGPIKDFCYDLPNEESIKEWIENKRFSMESQDLWRVLENYFKTFLDLPDETMYDTLVLFTFQTWIAEIMDTYFFVAIAGAWGAGKSATLEALAFVSKNSLLGQPTKAFLARMADEQKISVFYDELDSVIGQQEDNDLLSIFRVYRRNQKYPVMSKDLKPIWFDVGIPKSFVIKTMAEGALLDRALPITTVQSTEATLPAINTEKLKMAKIIKERLYLWYLDNILLYVDDDCCVDYMCIGDDYMDIRKKIVAGIRAKYKSTGSQGQHLGRNAEIAFVLAKITNFIGVNLDDNYINTTMEFKKNMQEEANETSEKSILRDILVKLYREFAPMPLDMGFRTEEEDVKVAHKQVAHLFNQKLKAEKYYGIGKKEMAGYLRDFGFDDTKAKKKIRVKIPDENIDLKGESPVRLALIFTPKILKKLEIQEIKPVEKAR